MSEDGYDRQEPTPKVVIGFALILFLFVTGAGLGVRGYFLNLLDDEEHVKVAEAPTTEVDKLRAAAQAEMHSYGWVDEKAGTMHMPIERAMEMEVDEAHAPTKTTEAHAPAKKADDAAPKASADKPKVKKAADKKDTKKK